MLELATVELDRFVLYTLLEDQVGTPVGAQSKYILEVGRVFDTVVDHLDKHSWVLSKGHLQTIGSLRLLKFVLVNATNL